MVKITHGEHTFELNELIPPVIYKIDKKKLSIIDLAEKKQLMQLNDTITHLQLSNALSPATSKRIFTVIDSLTKTGVLLRDDVTHLISPDDLPEFLKLTLQTFPQVSEHKEERKQTVLSHLGVEFTPILVLNKVSIQKIMATWEKELTAYFQSLKLKHPPEPRDFIKCGMTLDEIKSYNCSHPFAIHLVKSYPRRWKEMVLLAKKLEKQFPEVSPAGIETLLTQHPIDIVERLENVVALMKKDGLASSAAIKLINKKSGPGGIFTKPRGFAPQF